MYKLVISLEREGKKEIKHAGDKFTFDGRE